MLLTDHQTRGLLESPQTNDDLNGQTTFPPEEISPNVKRDSRRKQFPNEKRIRGESPQQTSIEKSKVLPNNKQNRETDARSKNIDSQSVPDNITAVKP